MASPSVTTPMSGAMVAVAMTLTTDVRMPPNTQRYGQRELDT